jgi:hypothetical protein
MRTSRRRGDCSYSVEIPAESWSWFLVVSRAKETHETRNQISCMHHRELTNGAWKASLLSSIRTLSLRFVLKTIIYRSREKTCGANAHSQKVFSCSCSGGGSGDCSGPACISWCMLPVVNQEILLVNICKHLLSFTKSSNLQRSTASQLSSMAVSICSMFACDLLPSQP